MSIEPTLLITTLIGGLVVLAIGIVIGWLIARPATETSLRDTFRALSDEALKSNNQAFLDLAETRLRDARTAAAADIDQRKVAIEHLLAPMAKTLGDVDREIREAERRRTEAGAQLLQRIASLDTAGQDLRAQTGKLVDALKRPGVRGRWGELQLKRVVELAGMVQHCDFEEQYTVTNGDGDRRMRPDVIVRLPGGKHVVIDAKAPLDAYLKALEAPDEASRQALLCEHARQVRTHVSQLAAKGYAAHVHPSPDFVVMFLPGRDVLQRRARAGSRSSSSSASSSTSFRRARRRSSRCCGRWRTAGSRKRWRRTHARSPTSAVSCTRPCACSGDHFGDLGGRLKSSLEAYNRAVGSLEGNVLVKARKFKELQAATALEEIAALEPVDKIPRMLQAAELTGGLPFLEGDTLDESR